MTVDFPEDPSLSMRNIVFFSMSDWVFNWLFLLEGRVYGERETGKELYFHAFVHGGWDVVPSKSKRDGPLPTLKGYFWLKLTGRLDF